MTNDKEDLRIRRTRKLLTRALFTLMQTTPFEKLSVNDICENALVHRATFYNHFNDKNDLLNYALDEIQEELYEATIEQGQFSSIKEMYTALASNMLDYIISHKQKILLIVKTSSEKMNKIIQQAIRRSVTFLASKNKYSNTLDIPQDIVVSFVIGGLTSVCIDYINAENPHTKDAMMKFISIILDTPSHQF